MLKDRKIIGFDTLDVSRNIFKTAMLKSGTKYTKSRYTTNSSLVLIGT